MAEYTIPARPTVYKGIRMRSRLEAKFAQDFDTLGWTWEYEPECFADETGQYLPDFALLPDTNGDQLVYLEIKGAEPDDIEAVQRRMEIIWSSEPTARLALFVNETDTMYGVAPGLEWKVLPAPVAAQ